jgi:hypothetical protein
MKLKPGITTTEFYVTIGGVLVQGALAAFGMIDAGWAAMGITLLGGLYNLGRFALKSKTAPAEVPPTQPTQG